MVQEDKLNTLFREMAKTLSDQYIHDIAAHTIISGARASFEELMPKLKMLEKDLTEKAVKLIEAYKKETGREADHLTDNFKYIIANTIQDFIKQL